MLLFICFRTRSGLDKESLEWLEKIFRETVGDEKEIRREDFNKILLSKNVSIRLVKRSNGTNLCYFIVIHVVDSFSLSSRTGFLTYSTRTTAGQYLLRNSSMPCTSLQDKPRTTKSDFSSRFTISTVSSIDCVLVLALDVMNYLIIRNRFRSVQGRIIGTENA